MKFFFSSIVFRNFPGWHVIPGLRGISFFSTIARARRSLTSIGMRWGVAVFLINLSLSGCIDLAVNNGKNKQIASNKLSHSKGEVYTMRGGLGGIFSKGMNRLEDTLENNYRIYAASTVWYKGNALSHRIIQKYKTSRTHNPIVLVGHSLGANEQIQVAKDLNRVHIPVALLITVDAVIPATVPPNVAHAVNIYKTSFVPLFSGLRLKVHDPKHTQIENLNVATIKGVKVNHFTIDGNPNVQTIMRDRILTALRVHSNKNHHAG